MISAIGCAFFLALSQVPDPAWIGVHDEPDVILLYGGSGLLAGAFALSALVSGGFLLVRLRKAERQ